MYRRYTMKKKTVIIYWIIILIEIILLLTVATMSHFKQEFIYVLISWFAALIPLLPLFFGELVFAKIYAPDIELEEEEKYQEIKEFFVKSFSKRLLYFSIVLYLAGLIIGIYAWA